MDEMLARFLQNFVERVHGPMHLRLLLQPLMATVFAIRDGRKDAAEGKAAYGWALFSNPGHRRDLLKDGWKSVGKIFCLATVLDCIFQVITVKWIYPVEAMLVAALLALVPYLLLRGPANRLFRMNR